MQMSDLDMQARDAAIGLGDDVNRALLNAAENTQVGGSISKMLNLSPPDCPTKRALDYVDGANVSGEAKEAALRRVHAILIRKTELLRRLRVYVRAATLVRLWLYFHIPLSIAALVALAAHVLAVFFYW